MMRLSEEEITAVRNSADIAEVIGHYLPLVKKGRSMACVCPFHDDHDPSLSISQDKQIYKCFVCGAGGNVFTFVQNYEKVSFPEAVAKVAEISGYKLSFDPSALKTPVDPKKDVLYKVLAETIRYTHYQLGAQAGTPVRQYLSQRGIDEATIEKFEIGWNGPGDELLRFLQAKGYNEQDMVASNVVRLNESGLHDVFSSRITFPIHDSLGNPIGFTARSMDPEAQSKYINTTETDVYVKGHTVFNYHRAKQPSRQEGRVLLCEGVTDVLAFSQAGMDNVVATLGTACTAEQLRLLRQCSLHLTFCYDGDKAGQNATYKAAQLARAAGFEVGIVNNQTGLDPDEILRRHGAEELKAMTRKELTWMEFVFQYLASRYDLENYSEKKEFTFKVEAEIKQLTDEFDRQNFAHQLEQLTGFHLDLGAAPALKAEDSPSSRVKRVPVRLNPSRDGKTNAEHLILALMLTSRDAVEMFKEKLGFLLNEENQQLAMMILDYSRSHPQLQLADFISTIDEEALRQKVLDLSEWECPQFTPEVMEGAVRRLQRCMLEERINDLKQQILRISNPESQAALLHERMQLQRELRGYLDEEKHQD